MKLITKFDLANKNVLHKLLRFPSVYHNVADY